MRFDNLPGALHRPLPPLWVVTGEEPLLLIEAADMIRSAAQAEGYGERVVLNASASWDWSRLQEACQSMSLFAERRIIELRLASDRPGTRGADALARVPEMELEETVLVVTIPSSGDRSVQKLRWYQSLTRSPRVKLVECPRVDAPDLPCWLSGRLAQAGINAEDEAVRLLAERCEGNLLAAKQEIMKLSFCLDPGTTVTAEKVRNGVGDVSRFDADDFCEAAMRGEGARAVRALGKLQEAGAAIPSFLWVLDNDLRAACRLKSLTEAGQPEGMAERAAGLYRQYAGYQRILSAGRRLTSRRIAGALIALADIDRISKGLNVKTRDSDAWIELASLAAYLARTR